MTHGPKHAFFLQRVVRWSESQSQSTEWHVRQQLPVTFADSEPEPDVVLVRGRVEDYRTRHPRPAECLLLIEIADSSLDYDRTVKGAIYAASGIESYWIVNVPEQQVETYEIPVIAEKRYSARSIRRAADQAVLKAVPGFALTLTVESLFA
jgi:hypothetical protein